MSALPKKVVIATPEKLAKINPKNVELWRKYLNGMLNNLSEASRYNYTSDMNQFFIYILDNYDNKYLFDFDTEEAAEMIEDFIAFCTTVLGNKTRRISRRLSSISSMYIYYKKKRKIKENPIELLERPKIAKGKHEIKQTFLTKEQVELIRKKLSEMNDIQLELFFEFALSTMARINAIANTKVEQINLETRRVENVLEKEGYLVTLFFSKKCKELIEKWLQIRREHNIDCEYLFCTKTKDGWKQVSKSTFQNSWIKKIGNIINEPDLHCHDLRHSGSNLLYQNGMSLEDVSKLLNHKGTQVTQDFYLQINYNALQEKKDAIEI